MKARRDFYLDVETLDKVGKIAQREGLSESQAAEMLINSGFARVLEIDETNKTRFSKLAPDLTDLK